jgi:hypothetical protein
MWRSWSSGTVASPPAEARSKSRAAIIGLEDTTHSVKADRIELQPAG